MLDSDGRCDHRRLCPQGRPARHAASTSRRARPAVRHVLVAHHVKPPQACYRATRAEALAAARAGRSGRLVAPLEVGDGFEAAPRQIAPDIVGEALAACAYMARLPRPDMCMVMMMLGALHSG